MDARRCVQGGRAVRSRFLEYFRKDDLRLVMHVGRAAELPQRIGAAMTVARVKEYAGARGFSQKERKILPVGHGAEPFVKHDDSGNLRIASLNLERFEPVAADQVRLRDRRSAAHRKRLGGTRPTGANVSRTGVSLRL